MLTGYEELESVPDGSLKRLPTLKYTLQSAALLCDPDLPALFGLL